MPRRIATQVGQFVSRQLRGGYLKRPPVAFQTLLDHPRTPLPPRAPAQRADFDSAAPNGKASLKLSPQPIVYLEDRVRERFYNDHPWETFRPRTLVEGRTLSGTRVPFVEATDLTAWGRNPGPEDVVACVVHLHRTHGLSLSQAYHNTLSSYHALRAEHDHAARVAVYEARSYGGVFGYTHDGRPSSTPEIDRGFAKEGEEILRGARFYNKAVGGSAAVSGGAANEEARKKYRFRVRNTWAPSSRGEEYLRAALAARDLQPTTAAVKAPSSSASRSGGVTVPRAELLDGRL